MRLLALERALDALAALSRSEQRRLATRMPAQITIYDPFFVVADTATRIMILPNLLRRNQNATAEHWLWESFQTSFQLGGPIRL